MAAGSTPREANGTYTAVYDAGEQPRHQCEDCRWRQWAESGAPPASRCPRCDSSIITVLARRQIRKRGFKRKGDAQRWLTEQLLAVQTGFHVDPTKMTVREFLEQRWLPTVKQLSPNTYRNYESDVRLHIIPALGEVQLQKLDAPRVVAAWAQLRESGGPKREGLAPKSLKNVHFTMNKALEDAKGWDYVHRNVLERVPTPIVPPREMSVWTPGQMLAFLHTYAPTGMTETPLDSMGRRPRVDWFGRGRRLYALWVLAMSTGMRREELLGLRWRDIDWDASKLSVEWVLTGAKMQPIVKRPKSSPRAKKNHSRRQISLDAHTMAELRKFRKQQMAERLAAGEHWVQDLAGYFVYPDGQPSDQDLVFRQEDGTPLYADTLSAWFRNLVRLAGLPPIRLHDVRHSYATMMLASGQHVKVVSERLGHSSIAQTLDLYSWVMPSQDEEAAERGAELLWTAHNDDTVWVRRCIGCHHIDTTRLHSSAVEAHLDREWVCPACRHTAAVLVERRRQELEDESGS